MAEQQSPDPPKEETKHSPRWRSWLRLGVFAVITFLLLILAFGLPDAGADRTEVVFSASDVAQVSAIFERTWGRAPNELELKQSFDSYVRSEILYREALARGLDRNDPVVHMSLVKKITSLGASRARLAEPTMEEIQAYFDLRSEAYRVPAVVSFEQLQVNTAAGADAPNRLLFLLENAEAWTPEMEDLVSPGFYLPPVVRGTPEPELVDLFGARFASEVFLLPVGEWTGPVESEYGLHVVRIVQRLDSRIPSLQEVYDTVLADLMFEARLAAEDQFYAEILPRYIVSYETDVLDFLRDTTGSGR